MRLCPVCQNRFDPPLLECLRCDFLLTKIDGFNCFAPEKALQDGGFDPTFFSHLRDASDWHFFLKYRNRLILSSLQRYFPNFQSFLEIGCGTGTVLQAISRRYPLRNICGSDVYIEGLKFARSYVGSQPSLFQMDALKIPFSEAFDIIGLFDVIEHIEHQDDVLQGVFKALKYDGGVILTAPQHPILWSKGDEKVHHKRRYRIGELARTVQAAGFELVYQTSYNTLLLPALALSRILTAQKKYNAALEWDLHPILNSLFNSISIIEGAINRHIRLPFGSSVLVIGRKSCGVN